MNDWQSKNNDEILADIQAAFDSIPKVKPNPDRLVALIPDWDENGELTGEYIEVKEGELPPAPGWMKPGSVSHFLLGDKTKRAIQNASRTMNEPQELNRKGRRLRDKKK